MQTFISNTISTPCTQDLLGLQHLNSTGRIHFIEAPGDHLQFSLEWFDTNLMPYIKVDRSQVTLPLRVNWAIIIAG